MHKLVSICSAMAVAAVLFVVSPVAVWGLEITPDMAAVESVPEAAPAEPTPDELAAQAAQAAQVAQLLQAAQAAQAAQLAELARAAQEAQRAQAVQQAQAAKAAQAAQAAQAQALKAAQEANAAQAAQALKEAQERQAAQAAAAMVPGEEGPKTYVDVNLGAQTLTYFVDGNPVLSTPCVTGSPGRSTPSGVFMINSKVPGKYLTGPTWHVWVNRWMRFAGNVGIHDASWRKSFGGNIYRSNGSHGCVNIPFAAADQLFGMVNIGTVVVVH